MTISSSRAFALVSTLGVIVLLTVIVTAFMQSMSVERRTSSSLVNVYRAELAAESALQDALRALTTYTDPASGTPSRLADFHYFIGRKIDSSHPNGEYNTLVKLQQGSPALPKDSSGNVIQTPLTSFGNEGTATLSLNAGSNSARTDDRTIQLSPVEDPNGNVVAASGFYIDDNAGKQHALALPKLGVARDHGLSLRELPFIDNVNPAASTISTIADASADPFAAFINSHSTGWESLLLTPASLNQFADGTLREPLPPALFAVDTRSADLNPLGEPKVDLRRLKWHLDNTRADDQALGNIRAKTVEALLGTDPDNLSPKWGGGDLSWLTSPLNAGAYSISEARSIVANLLDYLDYDLHPTTDDANAPSFLGVEGRPLQTGPDAGKIRGHPTIVAVVTGCVFNKSSSSSQQGFLNSTRVLACVGIANPWSVATLTWGGSYSIELEFNTSGKVIGGTASPDPSDAQSYFEVRLDEQLTQAPVSSIPAYSAYNFPEPPTGSRNYANFYSFFEANNRQPAGLRFEDLAFSIKRLRIRFRSTDGTSSYVQILDNSSSLSMPNEPANFPLPISGGSTVYKLSGGYTTTRQSLFLLTDPRLNHQAGSWNVSRSTGGSTASPPFPDPAVNVFQGMSASEGDGAQGVTQGFNWYESTALQNHLEVASSVPLLADPASVNYTVDNPEPDVSIGNIGYLHTGRPWQTLRLHPYANPAISRQDWTLLDFLSPGTYTTSIDQGTPFTLGRINVNTTKPETFAALSWNIPGMTNAQSYDLMKAHSDIPAREFPVQFSGALAKLPDFSNPAATTDFAKEEWIRRIANPLTTRSSSFTIHCYGEGRSNGRTVGRAALTAIVELRPQAGGGVAPEILSITKN